MSGAAAYKGLQAPADYVGQAMTQNRQLDETRRANKRADALAKEQARAKAVEDKTKATKEAYDHYDKSEKFIVNKIKETGIQSWDDKTANVQDQVVEQVSGFYELAAEARASGDFKKAQEYARKSQSIIEGLEGLRGVNDRAVGLLQTYKDNVDNISPVDREYEGVMEAMFKNNYELTVDDKGKYRATFYIPGEDGEEATSVDVGLNSLFDGTYAPYENFDNSAAANKLVTDIGIFTEGDSWGKDQQMAFDTSWEAISGDKRKMSSLLYEASQGKIKKKGDPRGSAEGDRFTESDMELAKDYYEGKVKAARNNSNKVSQKDQLDINYKTLRNEEMARKLNETVDDNSNGESDYGVIPIGSGEDNFVRSILEESGIVTPEEAFATINKDGSGIPNIIGGKEIMTVTYNPSTKQYTATTRQIATESQGGQRYKSSKGSTQPLGKRDVEALRVVLGEEQMNKIDNPAPKSEDLSIFN